MKLNKNQRMFRVQTKFFQKISILTKCFHLFIHMVIKYPDSSVIIQQHENINCEERWFDPLRLMLLCRTVWCILLLLPWWHLIYFCIFNVLHESFVLTVIFVQNERHGNIFKGNFVPLIRINCFRMNKILQARKFAGKAKIFIVYFFKCSPFSRIALFFKKHLRLIHWTESIPSLCS